MKAKICECGAKVSKKFCPECGKSLYLIKKEEALSKEPLSEKELLPEKLKKFEDINTQSIHTLEPNEKEMLKRDQVQDKLEILKEKMSNKLREERKNDKQIK